MKIYHYKANTLEFVGESDARPDPRNKDASLLPANSTVKKPPTAGANEKAIFDSSADTWSLTPDHRGVAYYDEDRAEKRLNLGETPDPAWETDIDSVPLKLNEVRALKRAKIQQHALTLITAATNVIDTFDEIQFIAKIWPGLDTAALGAGMLAARDIYVYARTKMDQLSNASRAQIEGYDPATDTGWP